MSTQIATDTYQALHTALAAIFTLDREQIDLEPVTGRPAQILTRKFRSTNWGVHPPENEENTNPAFRRVVGEYIERYPYSERNFFGKLQPSDRDVPENLRFRYPVFVPGRARNSAAGEGARARSGGAIILLHGLNEKSWLKYLPWALELAEKTTRPVILFPIAFHMNRAPGAWSNPREMIGVSRERRKLFPGVAASSFVNAALSHRVQFAPHRFLTSGLQSYYDVTDLARHIRSGADPLFTEGARIDIFGYSIGATLAELLLLSDPAGLFADSRAFLFCGGSVMDRTNPVSKAIMDGEAHRGMLHFLEQLVSESRHALPRGIAALKAGLWEVEIAKSLLFTGALRHVREKAMRAVGDRIAALAMVKDKVFPPAGLEDSWTATDGSMLMNISTADPQFDYAHEQPLPADSPAPGAVDRFFREMISVASAHLRT
jgi:pimeloyl-ACP methyl ester carboxylesterase